MLTLWLRLRLLLQYLLVPLKLTLRRQPGQLRPRQSLLKVAMPTPLLLLLLLRWLQTADPSPMLHRQLALRRLQ